MTTSSEIRIRDELTGPSKEPCGTLNESRPQVGLYDTVRIRYDTITTDYINVTNVQPKADE